VGKTNLQAGLFSKSGTAQAYRVIVEKHGRATPRKLGSCSHREWVLMLGEAHYVRYDETTAARLLSLGKKLRPCRRFRAPRPALYPTCEALKSTSPVRAHAAGSPSRQNAKSADDDRMSQKHEHIDITFNSPASRSITCSDAIHEWL
jgi:hypothetical protein